MTMPITRSFLSQGSATPSKIRNLISNVALTISILSLERAASKVLFKDSDTPFTNPFLVVKLNWECSGIYQRTYEGCISRLHDKSNLYPYLNQILSVFSVLFGISQLSTSLELQLAAQANTLTAKSLARAILSINLAYSKNFISIFSLVKHPEIIPTNISHIFMTYVIKFL